MLARSVYAAALAGGCLRCAREDALSSVFISYLSVNRIADEENDTSFAALRRSRRLPARKDVSILVSGTFCSSCPCEKLLRLTLPGGTLGCRSF